MPHKTASLATWLLLLSNPLPQSWASHSVHAQVALATPTIRETQRTYQGDLHNFSHSGDYLTPAWLPAPLPPTTRAARAPLSRLPEQAFSLGLENLGSSCSLSNLFFNSLVLASHTFLSQYLFQLLLYPINLLSGHLF